MSSLWSGLDTTGKAREARESKGPAGPREAVHSLPFQIKGMGLEMSSDLLKVTWDGRKEPGPEPSCLHILGTAATYSRWSGLAGGIHGEGQGGPHSPHLPPLPLCLGLLEMARFKALIGLLPRQD